MAFLLPEDGWFWLSPKLGFASAIKKPKNYVFIFYCARLAPLWLSPKLGFASAIKKSKNYVFIFYCARLALTLQSNRKIMRRNFFTDIPPVTRHLLLINVVLWLATIAFNQFTDLHLIDYLGLHYLEANSFNPAQFVTYMFLHDDGGVMHILCNMYALYMFGSLMERTMGIKRYLIYYMVCGIGAGLVQEAVMYFELHDIVAGGYQGIRFDNGMVMPVQDFLNMNVVVGASGAIFGIMLAFGIFYANTPLYLFFIPVPIKAKYAIIGYGVIELMFGVTGTMSGVAHFAHLGGMVFGIILILIWMANGTIRRNR